MSYAVPDDPVGNAERRVDDLVVEQKELRAQILELKKCREDNSTVAKLQALGVYIEITEENRTTPEGKQKISDEITELKDQLKV